MIPGRLYKHWEQVRKDLYATIDMFNDDELIFTPFDGSWSIGQIMLHIADCEDNWLHGVVGGEFVPWISYNLADYPTRAAIKEILEQARKRTVAFFENLDEHDLDKIYTAPNGEAFTLDWIIWHVLEHEIHHRGELSLALGLLGCGGLDI